MAGTVKFDNQPAFPTIKVDNVRTYALLPAKLLTPELTILKILPEYGFCCS
jgi:hypothetical protein